MGKREKYKFAYTAFLRDDVIESIILSGRKSVRDYIHTSNQTQNKSPFVETGLEVNRLKNPRNFVADALKL